MRPQIPLDHILRVWSTSPSATVAACSLGISQRTLYYRIEKGSLAELRDAFAKLQGEAEAQLAAVRNAAMRLLLVRKVRLDDLTRQMETLSQEKDTIERQRAILVRENDTLREQLQRLTLQGPRHCRDPPQASQHLPAALRARNGRHPGLRLEPGPDPQSSDEGARAVANGLRGAAERRPVRPGF